MSRFFSSLALVAALAIPLHGDIWQVEQLTDNDYTDRRPLVSGSHVAWTQYAVNDNGPGEYRLLLHDGTDTQLIAVNPGGSGAARRLVLGGLVRRQDGVE